MRRTLLLVIFIASSLSVFGQGFAGVQASISLSSGASSFRIGDPIRLQLTFVADEPGYCIDVTTTQPVSLIDKFVISPTRGVSQVGGYWPDYAAMEDLEPRKPVSLDIALNDVYRFNQPGQYTVHVSTSRVSMCHAKLPLAAGQPLGVSLTTNDVTFDVTPMSESDEATDAARLEVLIRSVCNSRTAEPYERKLNWLRGDPSTRVKLDLLLHPTKWACGTPYHCYFVPDVSSGLWNARNRALVIATLEKAMDDPEQPISQTLLDLAVRLKSSLQPGYEPPVLSLMVPPSPEENRIEDNYLRLIASTLPQRRNANLRTTSATLLEAMARRGETHLPQFEAAREALIANFDQLDVGEMDVLLRSLGRYLQDPSIVPAMERALLPMPAFPEGIETLRHLIAIAPYRSKPFVVAAICDPTYFALDAVRSAPFKSLPEVDRCLDEDIHQDALKGQRGWAIFEQKSVLASRFATLAIYKDLYSLYVQDSKNWNGAERGAVLAYLARYNGKDTWPLLEAALPANAPQPDANVTFELSQGYYSSTLERFFRSRLDSPYPGQVEEAAYEMQEHGPPEDRDLIRKVLSRWGAKSSGKPAGLTPEQAMFQVDLIDALVHAKNWQVSPEEKAALVGSCLSETCRKQFGLKGN